MLPEPELFGDAFFGGARARAFFGFALLGELEPELFVSMFCSRALVFVGHMEIEQGI